MNITAAAVQRFGDLVTLTIADLVRQLSPTEQARYHRRLARGEAPIDILAAFSVVSEGRERLQITPEPVSCRLNQVEPFSRRAFLQALATIAGAVALPLDLVASAPDAQLATTSAARLAPTFFEIHQELDPIGPFDGGFGQAVYLPGLLKTTIRMRCPPDTFVPPGDVIELDECLGTFRIQAKLMVKEVYRSYAGAETIVTTQAVGPVTVTEYVKA
jgi:hypothetical protein